MAGVMGAPHAQGLVLVTRLPAMSAVRMPYIAAARRAHEAIRQVEDDVRDWMRMHA